MKTSKIRFEEMLKKLKDNGYKITPQRQEIVKILSVSKGHPSVEKIHEQIKQIFPTMSLATVYKNVTIIKEIGEVLELSLSGGNRYDGNKPYPHPHLICTKCQDIIDWEMKDLQRAVTKMVAETGYKITNHRLDFFGLCPGCQQKNLL